MLSEGDCNFSYRQEKPVMIKTGIFAVISRTLRAYVYKRSRKAWTQRAVAPCWRDGLGDGSDNLCAGEPPADRVAARYLCSGTRALLCPPPSEGER